ncbi:ABC transporter six-transmembrane domain-containing protein [Polaribacter sp. Z022]|uniref:ABC transporter six-transmembrane domain-containing protein n=1 Tax=Polaribacter sp. Z022 TaxID=2927125 RepID=UPI0020200F90|nr:ABC transporter six-transmembrane domain-containing protein [Polaribacter sp. Z022]MCL7752146.1 ABC transporter six-transmembrane domain-containing protein [Polaribacter sp. Z022]
MELGNQYAIKSIFKRFKLKISITFILLIFENVSKVLQPLVLGIAINDLLNKKNDGLWLFSILYSFGFLVGIARRYYDTRIYTFIYSKVASEITNIQHQKNISVSSIAARSSLIKELIDFFEHDVAQAFTSLIGVVGALIMLTLFNWYIFIACLITIVLIVIIYLLSNTKIYNFNIGLNDELENRITVLEAKDQIGVISHFKNISKWLVKLSDLETLNFGIIEILLFLLATFTLYISASSLNVTAGDIFATLTYILEFSNGIFMLPIVFQQVIRLQEISSRLKSI